MCHACLPHPLSLCPPIAAGSLHIFSFSLQSGNLPCCCSSSKVSLLFVFEELTLHCCSVTTAEQSRRLEQSCVPGQFYCMHNSCIIIIILILHIHFMSYSLPSSWSLPHIVSLLPPAFSSEQVGTPWVYPNRGTSSLCEAM